LNHSSEQLVDAALARLPEWQPPPGFAVRVAARACLPPRPAHWAHLLPRGLSIAAGVSVAAWLSTELLAAGLQWMAGTTGEVVVAWALTAASLAGTWRLVSRRTPRHA
jgi:hypothetical protein